MSHCHGAFRPERVTFPLPKDYFGRVQVSDAQKIEYQDLVRRRVNAVRGDEQRYAERKARKLPCLPPADWKYVRSYQELKVYRRRRRGRSLDEVAMEEDFPEAAEAVANGQPSIVATGSIAGTVENLLYGFADTNYEEMRTTTSFQDTGTDANILRIFELATASDPLHFFGLKWLYNSSAPIIVPRDICFLEAMGVEYDENDEKYGFLILHSVDLPECPPFDPSEANVLRGKLYFSCLFRDAAPGIVDVVIRGIFDTAGAWSRLASTYTNLMPYATAAFVGGLIRAVECADAKKLTLLARYNAVSGRNRDALNVDEDNPKHGVCAVCIRRVGTGVFSCGRLRWCRICGIAVCSSCNVRNKRVFLGYARPWSPCICCPNCAQEARQMTGMRPAEPEYAVVADYFMESQWDSVPLAEDASQWTKATLDDPNTTLVDWKAKRFLGPLPMLSEARNLNSSWHRTTNSSSDESVVDPETFDDNVVELSDDDSERYHWSSSSDDVNRFYVFYSPTAESEHTSLVLADSSDHARSVP